MTKHINIDELLENYADAYGWLAGSITDSDRRIGRNDVKTAKQQIKDLMLEIIGSTELAPPKPDSMTQQEYMDYKSNMWARNDLRQEQLQKLTNLFNEKEK